MAQLSRTLSEVLESATLHFSIIYCSFKVHSICQSASLPSVMLEMKFYTLLLKLYLLYCFHYLI